ncbi:hypothetical protein G6F32_016692 [Rhizopus arrhizus]|nr:hypothetical protein G6F32_016692 [Rhizopus arrhizus]
MRMAERHPQPGVLGRGPDHRTHVRHAGAATHPRLALDRGAQRQQLPGQPPRPLNLAGRRRRVARRELRPRRQPPAQRHRRHAESAGDVRHRVR